MSATQDGRKDRGTKKWWYGTALMAMFCIFFVGIDLYRNHTVTWSVWVVAAFLFFGVGFTFLNKYGRE